MNIARRQFLGLCATSGVGVIVWDKLRRDGFASFSTGAPSPEDIVAGLDMGTSKVCVAVGERLKDGTTQILGTGYSPSEGVTPYGIVEFESARACVRRALADAERKSGVAIRSVVMSIAGTKISPYGLAWEELRQTEEFSYGDPGSGILWRFDTKPSKYSPGWQVLAGAGPRILNSIHCVTHLGMHVERLVFASVASAEAMLSVDQKKLGALVIDMGEGTTDFAAYVGNALVLSNTYAIGGKNISNELSLGLGIPPECAEKLLIEQGSVVADSPDSANRIVIKSRPGFEGHVVECKLLNEIVHHRVRQTLQLVKCKLVNSGLRLDSFRAGMHLTGGCSLIPGICELAEETLGIPAFLTRTKGQDPRYSCAQGLLTIKS